MVWWYSAIVQLCTLVGPLITKPRRPGLPSALQRQMRVWRWYCCPDEMFFTASVASPKFFWDKCFEFMRAIAFCLGHRVLKHISLRYVRNLGAARPWLRLFYPPGWIAIQRRRLCMCRLYRWLYGRRLCLELSSQHPTPVPNERLSDDKWTKSRKTMAVVTIQKSMLCPLSLCTRTVSDQKQRRRCETLS